jgi:hydrogenase maturation protease
VSHSTAYDLEDINHASDAAASPRILVVGLGNSLLMDDGVGVHAVHALESLAPPGVLVVEVGTAVLDALHLFEWADKILAIDAMKAGGTPGSVYAFCLEDVAESGHNERASLHELGLLAALRFLPGPLRAEIDILGVEPATIDYGLDLTPTVAEALPMVVRAAMYRISQWCKADNKHPVC